MTNENAIVKLLHQYEQEAKTVALNLERSNIFKTPKHSKAHRLKQTTYFKIIPPKYDVFYDTVTVFDASKFSKEMAVLYEVGQEHTLLKKGGFKWIWENSQINWCEQEQQFEILEAHQLRLKYQKEPDEYEILNKLGVNTPPIHNTNVDWKRVAKQNEKATALAKEGLMKQVIKREVISSNGRIEAIDIKDLERHYTKRENMLVLKKGNWHILKENKIEQSCEVTLKNIQICLRRLGYATNIDGEITGTYKMAKALFSKENNVAYGNEELFLEALGW